MLYSNNYLLSIKTIFMQGFYPLQPYEHSNSLFTKNIGNLKSNGI